MTLTKLQEDIMTVTYAQAQVDLITMLQKDKYTSLTTIMNVCKKWKKVQKAKIEKLNEDYEEPMELDTE